MSTASPFLTFGMKLINNITGAYSLSVQPVSIL